MKQKLKLKRFMGLMLTLAMIMGLMPGMSLTALAATAIINGTTLTWERSETGTLTISGTGAMPDYGDIDPPWKVTDNSKSIKSIVINDGVTRIGKSAFSQSMRFCDDKLTQVTIPSSVTSVGGYVFNCCSGITNVNLGCSVIGEGMFQSCHGLTQITLPSNLTNIGDYAFNSCTGLTQITIPANVANIGSSAFYCNNLVKVTFIPAEEGKTLYIGSYSFYDSTKVAYGAGNTRLYDGDTEIKPNALLKNYFNKTLIWKPASPDGTDEADDSGNKGITDEKVEQHEDTPETSVSGVSDELTNAVAKPQEKAAIASGAKATFTFELTNADNTVPAAEKQSLENVVKNEAPNAVVGMFLDLKAYFQVENLPKRQLDNLNGKTVTFNFKVPEKHHAPAGTRRTFFILQNHLGKISILARTTATNILFSAGDFSTYALAYSDESIDKDGFNTSIKIKQSEDKIKVSWDKVNGVSKVKVYATYCGKDYPSKPVKTTKGNSVTIKKLSGKKLNLKKNFKLYLVAYDKDGNKIGKTPSVHFAGKDSNKYTNPKSIKVSNKNISVAVGSKVKVKATIKLENKKLKELPNEHAEKFRYRSTKDYIATVDKKGNIKGMAPGTCTVYVYAKNGLAKKVTVTVK